MIEQKQNESYEMSMWKPICNTNIRTDLYHSHYDIVGKYKVGDLVAAWNIKKLYNESSLIIRGRLFVFGGGGIQFLKLCGKKYLMNVYDYLPKPDIRVLPFKVVITDCRAKGDCKLEISNCEQHIIVINPNEIEDGRLSDCNVQLYVDIKEFC